MRKYVTQMLDDINTDPANIANFKGDGALRLIFEYAFDPEKKMILPEGEPPFKPAPAGAAASPPPPPPACAPIRQQQSGADRAEAAAS